MALRPDTRQYPVVAYVEFTYADIPGSTAVAAIALPTKSIVTEISLYVVTSFAGGSTHDLDIGDATDDDEYTPTISELDGSAGFPTNAPAASGFQTTLAEPDIELLPAHTGGNPTSGAARLIVEYVTEGRFHENFE